MCGIVGFTGTQQAAPILLNGLSKLEYRGYDSAGIAVRDGERLAQVVKAKGRLSNLIEKTDEGKALIGTCGIGHTRWATHGEPSQINAHPHVSGNCTRSGSGEVESEVVGVHNGIIENYTELKEKLLKHGYTFYSQTDTEVVIKLVDYYYKKYNLGPIDAIAKTMVRVRGSYALELMFKDYPGEIWVARKDSPMIIGIAEDGWLPKFFTKKFNVVVTLAIISILPIIGGFSLDNIVSMMLVPGMAIGAITNFQAMSMPERFPEEWANSGLKCSPTLYRILMVISIITSLMTSFFSLTSLTLPMAIGTVIATILIFVWTWYRMKKGYVNITSTTDMSEEPAQAK